MTEFLGTRLYTHHPVYSVTFVLGEERAGLMGQHEDIHEALRARLGGYRMLESSIANNRLTLVVDASQFGNDQINAARAIVNRYYEILGLE